MNNVHNYNEKLVEIKMKEMMTSERLSSALSKDDLADIFCIALNRLPPRYIRYGIDLAFHLSDSDQVKMQTEAEEAILSAARFIHGDRRKNRPDNQTPVTE